MSAHRLATGRPGGLPVRHLGGEGHERHLGGEVLTDAGAIAEGICIRNELVGSHLHAQPAEDGVRGERECLLERGCSVVVVAVVGYGAVADGDGALGVADVIECRDARIERGGEGYDLER